jgi:peptidoglycan/xylan/chitin deacetylase (PgdA/CDA1 family)
MLGPVDLAFVAHEGDGPSAEYNAIDGLECHEIKPSRGARRAAVYASERLKGTPDVCCRGTSPELIEVGERLARARDRGMVVVGDMGAATALLPLARTQPVIYNAHNIESEYVRGRAGERELARWAMLRYERRLLSRAAESWMVSRTDIGSARALVPDARLRYVPNVVDVGGISPVTRGAADGGRLMMVGDFRYPPNVSGLQFLVGAVMPIVWRTRPQARLEVVGRGLEGWSSPDERVNASGFVADLAAAYGRTDCVVVPLTEGAGTPLKFVEALAYGMPIVATPLAAKGLDVVAGMHFREGSDGPGFAAAIIAALEDGNGDMGRQARELAEREYSIEALAASLSADPPPEAGAAANGLARSSPPARRRRRAQRAGSAVETSARWLAHAARTAVGHRYPFVLCYHGVGAIKERDPSGIFVSRELLERHLDVIAEQRYELLTVGDLWWAMDRGWSVEGRGSITFDDGLVKTVREAIPLLIERSIPCSLFVATGLFGQRHPDLPGELIASAEEVAELASAGVEIGAHSVDHVRLTELSFADALDQMRRSRATLEDLLQRPVKAMAYPFGALDERTVEAARVAGYEIACACSGPGPWVPMSIPREPVYATATPLRLRLKMAGLYGPAHVLAGPAKLLTGERGPLGQSRANGGAA